MKEERKKLHQKWKEMKEKGEITSEEMKNMWAKKH